METTKFIYVSDNEVKFSYKGHTFMLIEQSRGVYGMGSAIQLYELNGLKRTHIKEIAWSKDDNHNGMAGSDAYYRATLCSMVNCQRLALEYLDKLLG